MKTMKNLNIIYVLLFNFIFLSSNAQESKPDTLTKAIEQLQSDVALLKNLKITGYIQTQVQFADSSGISSYAGGNFPANTDKRFQVRRGRLKFAYSSNTWSQFVVQFDITENGFKTKDAYAKFTDPFINYFTLTGGVFNRPWGYEIEYSSSLRESPERTRFNQTVFKDERDLEAMLTIQAPKTARFNFIKLDVGLFSGTAINPDFDKFKDLITRLNFTKSYCDEKLKLSADLSYYYGGFANQTVSLYKFWVDDNGVKRMDAKHVDQFSRAKRELFGADIQVLYDAPWGLTTLRGEYAKGQQAALQGDATSPMTSPGATGNAYVRQTAGYYIYFVQNIAQSRHSIVIKYDVYDPNTQISGNDIIAANGFTKADVKYNTLGLGYACRLDANTKLMIYRDLVANEKTALSGYTQDLKDNVWTIRLQYKF